MGASFDKDLLVNDRWRAILTVTLTLTCGSTVLGSDGPMPGCSRQPIHIFRGFVGYWPDAFCMAGRMANRGYFPRVYRSSDVPDVVSRIAAGEPATQGPINLIGYSYGASACVTMAEDLMEYGISVDRMVLIECYDHPVIPANVKYCVNIYESRPLDHVQPFRGTPARAADPSATILIDIDIGLTPGWEDVRKNNHFNIADDPQLQDFVASQFPDIMPPVPGSTPGKKKTTGFLAGYPLWFGQPQGSSYAANPVPPDNYSNITSNPTGSELVPQHYSFVPQQDSRSFPHAEPRVNVPQQMASPMIAAPTAPVFSPSYRYPNPPARAPRLELHSTPQVRPYTSYRVQIAR